MVNMSTGHRFPERCQSEVQELEIFLETAAAIALGDVPMHGVHRSDLVGSNSPKLELKLAERRAGQDVKVRRILPDDEFLITAIDVLALSHKSEGKNGILEYWNNGMLGDVKNGT